MERDNTRVKRRYKNSLTFVYGVDSSVKKFFVFFNLLSFQGCSATAVNGCRLHTGKTNSANAELPSRLRGHAQSAHGHIAFHEYQWGVFKLLKAGKVCTKFHEYQCLETHLDAGCTPYTMISSRLRLTWQGNGWCGILSLAGFDNASMWHSTRR